MDRIQHFTDNDNLKVVSLCVNHMLIYMLLPFYIFNLEGKLDRMDRDPIELEKFSDIYRDIIKRLDEAKEAGYLSGFSYGVIIALIHKVAYKMTVKRENVQRKVGDLMGGKVLDLDIIRAKHEGIAEGITLGKAEGITLGKAEGITLGKAEGITLGEARGKAEERKDNIRKLAVSYMENDISLTEEKAIEMATGILG